jgi:threonine synthase
VAVFYPSDGVSDAQKLQMTTQEGDNVFVAGINGNFDDAQTGVKKLFADPDFIREASEAGYALSSANSINIGRLAPQIVYYFHAYAQLCRNGYAASGDGVDITVPTGNFGNILAAYYAALSGLPAKRLICASNANKALYDYFATGVYDANRPFVTTSSPSMDILISSNFERFLWLLNNSGRGGAGVSTVMESLAKTGKFTYPYEGGALAGEYADENETFAAIKRAFRFGYLIDPHTAVAFAAYEKDRAKNPSGRPNIIVSTASPYKFASSVISAITGEPPKSRDFAGQIEELETLSGFPAPASLKELDQKPILHKTLCGADEMRGLLRGFRTRSRAKGAPR